jgi:hypothetical protein
MPSQLREKVKWKNCHSRNLPHSVNDDKNPSFLKGRCQQADGCYSSKSNSSPAFLCDLRDVLGVTLYLKHPSVLRPEIRNPHKKGETHQ